MRVVWVNPAFLDYRVPVYAALDALTGGKLTVIFSRRRVRTSVARKMHEAMGERAIALDGEWGVSLGAHADNFANVGVHVPYQPGLSAAIGAASPDVLISEGFFQWTPAALMYKIGRRVPLVVGYERTAHTERNAAKLRLAYRRLAARLVDAIACNGSLSKDFCVSTLSVPKERIVVGAMAADSAGLASDCAATSAVIRSQLECRLGLNRPVFLYVGRLIELKGLRELLRGWHRYWLNAGAAGSLLLVGDGPERAALEQTVRDLSLRNVVFAGRVEYDAIAPYYAVADVLVMPTLEDNWSLVVPEAMACGLPILCSKYNGCWPELVQSDVNGWVFDPNDAEGMAGLFRRCVESRDRLPAMGAASRRIVANYTPSHAARAVFRACEIALNGRRRVRCQP